MYFLNVLHKVSIKLVLGCFRIYSKMLKFSLIMFFFTFYFFILRTVVSLNLFNQQNMNNSCYFLQYMYDITGFFFLFYYTHNSDLTIATKCSRFMPGLLALVSASLSSDDIRKPAAFPEYPPWEATYRVRKTTTCDSFKQTMIQNPGAQSEWHLWTHAQTPLRLVYYAQIKEVILLCQAEEKKRLNKEALTAFI